MKRWRVLVVVLTIIGVVGYGAISILWEHSATLARQREAHYQASLRAYSEALRLGVTRKEVEAYLHRPRGIGVVEWRAAGSTRHDLTCHARRRMGYLDS